MKTQSYKTNSQTPNNNLNTNNIVSPKSNLVFYNTNNNDKYNNSLQALNNLSLKYPVPKVYKILISLFRIQEQGRTKIQIQNSQIFQTIKVI
jgi:hypothetical protein